MATQFATGLYRNPVTGQRIDTAKQAQITPEDLTAQGFSPLLSRREGDGEIFYQDLPDGKQFQEFIQRPVGYFDNPVPEVIKSDSNNIVDSTQPMRDETTMAKQDADSAISSAEAGTESAKSVLDRLNEERQRIGEMTQAELDSIEAAGEAARKAFQPIVEEQEDRRKQTLPSEIVRAGERGGFLSTQQAGVASLLPTEGREGESFVGAGGALDRTRQTLDRAVTLARTKQQEAIENAKAARRQAILTGKKEDYNMAVDLAKLANEFKNDAENLNIKKQQLALSMSAEERAWRAEERAGEKFQYDVFKDQRDFEIGQERFDRTQGVQEAWLMRSLTEDDRKQAQENIISMANSGIPLSELTPEEITELEVKAGYEPGSFEAIYSRAYKQARMGDAMDMAKLEKAQLDVAKSKKSLAGGGSGSGNGRVPAGMIQAGNLQIPETGDTFQDTVNYLQALKTQDMLNDFNYREQVNSLMNLGGYENREEVESLVNQALEAMSPVAEPTNEGSDFTTDTRTFEEQGLGKMGLGGDTNIEGLKNFGKAYWDTMNELDKAKYAPKTIIKEGWGAVKKYLFG